MWFQLFPRYTDCKGTTLANHRVLVHSGDLNAGHYYALIRPKKDGKWFRYDDDKVIPVREHEVLNDNFGGETNPTRTKAGLKFFTNAYMLVYIRESDEDEMLAEVHEDDIPLHLREKVKQEMEEMERRRIEIEERHLYMPVQYVIENQLHSYGGFDIGFPMGVHNSVVPHNSPVVITKAKKDMTFLQFVVICVV
jgi:ubiquitin carboxyl-terminal hydrolase 7